MLWIRPPLLNSLSTARRMYTSLERSLFVKRTMAEKLEVSFRSTEETTPGDPLSMLFYALALEHRIGKFNTPGKNEQNVYADDKLHVVG